MKIAVLDFTTPYAGMEDRPTAGQMIETWLAPAVPEATIAIVDIAGGALLPALADYDAFVLGGSEKGVYDDTPWMGPLRLWLKEARAQAKPLMGICFGHQIMADVFGGKAEKAGYGLVCGTRRFALDGYEADVNVWHQDQVTRLPEGATAIGGAEYCPLGVIAYDFPALSVQFHPEYTNAFLTDEIETITGTVMAPDAARAALASIAVGNVQPGVYALETAAFLRASLMALPVGVQVA